MFLVKLIVTLLITNTILFSDVIEVNNNIKETNSSVNNKNREFVFNIRESDNDYSDHRLVKKLVKQYLNYNHKNSRDIIVKVINSMSYKLNRDRYEKNSKSKNVYEYLVDSIIVKNDNNKIYNDYILKIIEGSDKLKIVIYKEDGSSLFKINKI
jgi:hypothetical protein